MNWINFNGITSSSIASVMVMRITPPPRATRRVNTVIVPGRSGVLHVDDASYEPIMISVHIGFEVADEDKVHAWLNGVGKLVTSKDPIHAFNASIYAGYAPENIGATFREVDVVFECYPFRYLATPGAYITLTTSPTDVTNPGTMASEPIIMIIGTGDITLTIGNQIITLGDIDPGITINSEMMSAYNGITPLNDKMAGEFPLLPVGVTAVSWIGTVTSLTIKPNWRWL